MGGCAFSASRRVMNGRHDVQHDVGSLAARQASRLRARASATAGGILPGGERAEGQVTGLIGWQKAAPQAEHEQTERQDDQDARNAHVFCSTAPRSDRRIQIHSIAAYTACTVA